MVGQKPILGQVYNWDSVIQQLHNNRSLKWKKFIKKSLLGPEYIVIDKHSLEKSDSNLKAKKLILAEDE